MKLNPYALEHSLELYEKYPTVRCRPVCKEATDTAVFRVISLAWEALAPQKGVFQFEALPKPHTPKEANLLTIDLTPPAWADDIEDAAAFVRLLGAELEGGVGYTGALVELAHLAEGARSSMLRAWQVGFDRTALIVRATDTATLSLFQRTGIPFGLLLDASKGIMSIREAMAVNHLQRCWETAPVLLETLGGSEKPEALCRAARGWHVLAMDRPLLPLGRMALRRVTFPAAVASGGALPIRFWWQIMGDSPIYGRTKVVAKLVGDGGEAELPLEDERSIRLPGDATHNQIVPLPRLPIGEYALWVGVEGPDGRRLPLAIEGEANEGLYPVGQVTLDDTPRPELFAAWDHYYPEGYYPLEDPKLPY